MAITLNASTSSGLVQTADTSGVIDLQSSGSTKASVSSSGLSIAQYNPGASLITSGTAVSASGTSVDFTGIPSWVKRITINFESVSTNGSSAFIIQVGSGSFATSGYNGSHAYISGGSVSQTFINSGFGLVNSPSAAYPQSGVATLTLLGSNKWCYASNLSIDTGAAALWLASGGINLGGALDRVRLTTVNGTDTFDAGTINILYE